MVSAIVLAGGYATRLRPLSLTKPKALLPILGKPLLDYILSSLESTQQIDKIYLSLRVMAEKIIEHLKEERKDQQNVIPVIEPTRLGDAGALKYILTQQNDLSDDVLVVYGDIYNEVDYSKLLDFHQSKGCDATIVGTQVEDPKRYGVLLVDGDRLIQIIEKPKAPISNLINAGVYVFKKKLLEKIDGMSISKDFLPRLLTNGLCITVYPYRGLWMDIGVPSDYMRINLELLALKYPKGYIDKDAKVSEKAVLKPPFYIGEGSVIGEDTIIMNSIIGKSGNVGKGCYIEESILMDDVRVGDFTLIKGSIVGDKNTLGKWSRIEESILGDEVTVYDTVLINKDTIILPYKEVTESVHDKSKIIL